MGWISGFLEIIETPFAKHQWYNIGIKHDFHALTSAGPRGRCWNPSLKGEGFNTSRVAQQMLMYQKSMFNRYYCIKHVFRSKTLEKLLKKFFLPVPVMARKSTLPANTNGLKTPLPGQRLTLSLLFTLLMITSAFMTASEWLFGKPQSRALTARELSC